MTALDTPIPLPARPQQRGGPVDDFVDRLSHPAPVQISGPFITAFQCLISFGLLPLVLWPTRWAEFLDSERHDLLELTVWWRRRVAPADAAALDNIARGLRPRPILVVLPWLIVGFNIVLMAILFTQGDTLSRLWDLTFRHAAAPFRLRWESNGELPAAPLELQLYSAWIFTLCAGYFCQWYAVRSHATAVHSLVRWTNKIGRDNQFLRIKNDALQVGMHPVWILLCVALCSQHAWWAIPMVFAGAMQQRYCMRSSPLLRSALASQARDAFAIVQNSDERFCTAGHCSARLPARQNFVPDVGLPCDCG